MIDLRGVRVAALALALLLSGGQGLRVRADANPMAGQGEAYIADPEAADDEPSPEAPVPAPQPAAKQPPPVEKAAPALPAGRVMAYPSVEAPLPPRRPFTDLAVQAPPEASPPPPPPVPEVAEKEAPGEEAEGEAPPREGQRVSMQELEQEEAKAPEPGGIEKQTEAVNIACLRPELLAIVQKAGSHFGATPVITSGQRFRGRRGSYHRKCMAADFILPGIDRSRVAHYLRTLPEAGGVGTYCHTKAVHIDIGDPRNWYQCGFRFRFAQR